MDGHEPGVLQGLWSRLSREQYASWAVKYDGELTKLRYATPARVAALLVEHFAPGARLLELGAGTGFVGAALEGLGSSLRLTATDLSPQMLDLLTSPVYTERLELDASQPLPFPPGSFDGVICAGLLEYIIEPGMVLANVRAVLRPGGKLLLTYAPAQYRAVEQLATDMILICHHPEAIAWHLASHGLTPIHQEVVPAYWNRGVQIIHHLVVVTAEANPEVEANSDT